MSSKIPTLTAAEAAALINHGSTIGVSGFTPAGAAKVVPTALAARARAEHEAGRPFKVAVVSGASTGDSLDGELARADALSWRTPYQTNKSLRAAINAGQVQFFDMHLSHVAQQIRRGFLGKINWAIVEACDITDDGEITLTTSVGNSPTILNQAERVIIELNRYHSPKLRGFHDIYEPLDPPFRKVIPIEKPTDRIGVETVKIDPKKIVGIVESNAPDEVGGFDPADELTTKIGANVADFIANEIAVGRIPREFLPLQSGVGNIANAVLGALGANPDIPNFQMYSEVIQDSVIGLIRSGKCTFATGTSLTIAPDLLKNTIYADMEFFRPRLLLRPQEITNNPEMVRRLGIITMNTAIEADIFGNINSTHIMGNNLMNGIGGSGDFTRNAYISIFTCPSAAKGGKISAIVPFASHLDHTEHDVQVIITEQGIADLRGKSPAERSLEIINKCAHPDYRDALMRYREMTKSGQTKTSLANAFAFHQQFLATGDMHGVQMH
ncbi:succinate CoA transferase [Ereboglobus luteus]|uniref:Acetyl-CoA hydrolase n=1 Tax=Ereboglobus luteus TaxID=1796921 RepID=A0A2U8DZ46_9BACT|nr:succinate CoA transferase [Ereboglobus luteus]AWI07899.1 acetyl-CoA hydrolase [Ereboglobus luteus]